MPALRDGILHQNRITESRVRENLLTVPYVFAKTMPENPHWYTLRKNWESDEAFVEAVEHMREFGYTEIYEGRKYTMYNLNGFKYWTMGAPIWYKNGSPCTILINRKPLDCQADYDIVADRYDTLFANEESHNENLEIFNRLAFQGNEKVLDIGCGTGIFIDYCRSAAYTGIDPSTRMLLRFAKAHSDYADRLINARLEEFHDAEGFDLIVALFGSANYIKPGQFERVLNMVSPGGRIFAMFYQERYVPVTYEKCGVALPHFQTSEYDLSAFRLTEHRDSFVIAEYTRPLEMNCPFCQRGDYCGHHQQ